MESLLEKCATCDDLSAAHTLTKPPTQAGNPRPVEHVCGIWPTMADRWAGVYSESQWVNALSASFR